MSAFIVFLSHLIVAVSVAAVVTLIAAHKIDLIERRCGRLEAENEQKNKRLVMISALETPGAAHAAKKMAAIARGTHPLVRELGRSPIAPRDEVVAGVRRNR